MNVGFMKGNFLPKYELDWVLALPVGQRTTHSEKEDNVLCMPYVWQPMRMSMIGKPRWISKL